MDRKPRGYKTPNPYFTGSNRKSPRDLAQSAFHEKPKRYTPPPPRVGGFGPPLYDLSEGPLPYFIARKDS